MNIMIFDTETINLQKPFCYNIGYVIVNTDNYETVAQQEFVVSEVWNNKMLFSTAYYAEKTPIYISRMKGKHILKRKWADIVTAMAQDIATYEISWAYAYNSSFDERVFEFNAEWFKTFNPLETLTVHDIRAIAIKAICKNGDYTDFCEHHELFTDSGNYSTTAETLYRYIVRNPDIVEEHTALADSILETAILKECVQRCGADIADTCVAPKSLERKVQHTLKIVDLDGKTHLFDYCKKFSRGNTIWLKS